MPSTIYGPSKKEIDLEIATALRANDMVKTEVNWSYDLTEEEIDEHINELHDYGLKFLGLNTSYPNAMEAKIKGPKKLILKYMKDTSGLNINDIKEFYPELFDESLKESCNKKSVDEECDKKSLSEDANNDDDFHINESKKPTFKFNKEDNELLILADEAGENFYYQFVDEGDEEWVNFDNDSYLIVTPYTKNYKEIIKAALDELTNR